MEINEETARSFDRLLADVCLAGASEELASVKLLEFRIDKANARGDGKAADELQGVLQDALERLVAKTRLTSRYITTSGFRCGSDCDKMHRALLVGVA